MRLAATILATIALGLAVAHAQQGPGQSVTTPETVVVAHETFAFWQWAFVTALEGSAQRCFPTFGPPVASDDCSQRIVAAAKGIADEAVRAQQLVLNRTYEVTL